MIITARLNAKLQPLDRGDYFEDPLNEYLSSKKIGEVVGAGTQMGENGEIACCDLEIELNSDDETSLQLIIKFLEKLHAPEGSVLILNDGKEIPFGEAPGLAIYLNGTELPDEVYAECDVNLIIEEFDRMLEGLGEVMSHWSGPTETALYIYGSDYEKMLSKIKPFIQSYPLCQKSRIVRS